MKLREYIKLSKDKKLVPNDKFDRFMRKARTGDIDARKATFCQQTENRIKHNDMVANITPSVY